jgi:hypothetical protein
MTRKPLIVLTPYFLAALILFLTWLTLATPSPVAVDAAPAPTATPITIEAVPQDGHCVLLVDGDTCYILTQPGCNWVLTKFGEDSMGVELECDPVRDEGVGVELKDGE